MKNPNTIVAFIDAPDPDNFVQLIALAKLHPEATMHVVLTGRPVKFNASKEHSTWQWDMQSSRMAQEASALRIKNFLRYFGINVSRVFDGGIAPRTLVPHWIHFQEYYKFLDVDPLAAIRHSELENQEELAQILLMEEEDSVVVAVGGPMTGLHQLMVRCPDVITRFKEVHAMFATWGNVELMQFGDKPRGALQFNVACDPQAAHSVLMGLDCPVYLMPTEVTRVKEIGFQNAQALKDALPVNDGTKALYHLYALWYDAAVRPRQLKDENELIFIHDVVAAFSLSPELRQSIYEVVPVKVTDVPYLPNQSDQWGNVFMKKSRRSKSGLQRFAATGLKDGGAKKYLDTLAEIFA